MHPRLTALLAVAALYLPLAQAAQPWPTRPVRIVVPFAPGGTSDLMARVVGQQLSEQLGQSFVVDNRAGASGMIGHGIVARATPDGYTLATVDSGFAIIPAVTRTMPYDPANDFTFITQVMGVPRTLVVRPSLKVGTLKDLIALARAHPGKFNYASGGTGGINHLSAELFNQAARVQLAHIPYKGAGAATTAVLSGEADMVIAASPTVVQLVRSGRLRALAVTTPDGQRFAANPEVPSMAEAGVSGMVLITWFGLIGPARMPQALVDRIQAEVARALRDPQMKDRLEGADLVGSRPEAFTRVFRDELRLWAGVVKTAGIRPE